jgi:hypothetical protein
VRRALQVDATDRRALRALSHLDAKGSHEQTDQQHQIHTRFLRRWFGIWLLFGALALVLGGFGVQALATRSIDGWLTESTPQRSPLPADTAMPAHTATPSVPEQVSRQLPELEAAWEAHDWRGAMDILYRITLLDGAYPGLDDAKCDTLVHWARDLVSDEQVKQAYEMYRRAREVCQGRPEVSEEGTLVLNYLSGKWRYDRGLWLAASRPLQSVYDTDPDLGQARTLLYTSYLSATHQLLDVGRLQEARQTAQSALEIGQDSVEAQVLLDQIDATLRLTPTPVPSYNGPKRIEISISEQRMYVWEGETLVYKWVCSTGEPGRDTAPGHYRVLEKIPEAWSSIWGLRMPYWLGIYWVGSIQNGIHALPINPNGTTLWAGYLGSRVSFGCIILTTENARTLYDWAPVGAPVWIHY